MHYNLLLKGCVLGAISLLMSLVVHDSKAIVILQEVQQSGAFTSRANNLTGLEDGDMAWGDVDNDKDLDLLVTGKDRDGAYRTILFRNDDGDLTETDPNLPGMTTASIDFGDYDQDGDLDLLMMGFIEDAGLSDPDNAIRALVFQNTGGTFEPINAGLPNMARGGAEWGDADGDGDLDILLSGHISILRAQARVYLNENGNFTSYIEVARAAESDLDFESGYLANGSATWIDYNNNNRLDILTTGLDQVQQRVVRTTLYRYTSSGYEINEQGFIPAFGGSAVFADIDVDGDYDLIVHGTEDTFFFNRRTVVYRNTNGTYSQWDFEFNVANSEVITADMTNNGSPDIIALGDGSVRILGNNKGIYTGEVFSFENSRNGSLAVADFDNDGDLDIASSGYDESNTLATRIYENGIAASLSPPQPPADLAAFSEEGTIVFTWDRFFGKNRDRQGVSYELRIGTTPGGSDVYGTQSHPDGTRLVPKQGRTLKGLIVYNALPDGTYYWSAQAIDFALRGSNFAEEQVFILGDQRGTPPDVLVESITVTPNPVNQNEDVEITYVLRNQGEETASMFTVNTRLAQSPTTVTVSDYLLHDTTLPGLAGGATHTETFTARVPPGYGGESYIWVIADTESSAGQDEADEENDKRQASVFVNDNRAFSVSFPLKKPGWTPGNAALTAIFDHQANNTVANGLYREDNTVVTFTAETGEFRHGSDSGDNGYKNAAQLPFVINGNYYANDESKSVFLQYDGHPGIDYGVSGYNVYAAADGTVTVADNLGTDTSIRGNSTTCFGKYVVIEHPEGYQTLYLHLAEVVVQTGEINRGDRIGVSGNSVGPDCSITLGAHLHFEVRKKIGSAWYPVDPYGWQPLPGLPQIDPYAALNPVENTYLWQNAATGFDAAPDQEKLSLDVPGVADETVAYTAQVSAGSDWLAIESGQSGIGPSSLTLAMDDNTGTDRTGVVTIETTAATGKRQDSIAITIRQKGDPTIGVHTEKSRLVDQHVYLAPNYPNPFSGSTLISFTLDTPEEVTLSLYDALGRHIRNIQQASFPSGTHEVRLYASDLSPGVYWYRFQAGAMTATRSMTVVNAP